MSTIRELTTVDDSPESVAAFTLRSAERPHPVVPRIGEFRPVPLFTNHHPEREVRP